MHVARFGSNVRMHVARFGSNVGMHVARFGNNVRMKVACFARLSVARLSVSVSVLVVVCVVYQLKTLPEWLRGHQTAIVW